MFGSIDSSMPVCVFLFGTSTQVNPLRIERKRTRDIPSYIIPCAYMYICMYLYIEEAHVHMYMYAVAYYIHNC